ncbi:MAG TPA: hypothetical protein DDZ66_09400 [Firmicutes bacterium]|nr:hypothetical protein [Bacillota bacterium]
MCHQNANSRHSLQMEGLGASLDAVLITGSHAAAGTQKGVLDHSWVGSMGITPSPWKSTSTKRTWPMQQSSFLVRNVWGQEQLASPWI